MSAEPLTREIASDYKPAERRLADVGLLDYYKQFEGMTEEEVNSQLREEADERKRKALTRVETLDLSQTTWPDLPHPEVVNAITFVARRGMQRYPHMRGSQLRARLAERHSVDQARLIVGNGSAELLSAATRALIEPGQELITSWPSYPLFPIMARRAHGRAVPVSGGVDALVEAVGESTRVVALASPNDPTGELLPTGELRAIARGATRPCGRIARRVACRVLRCSTNRLLAPAAGGQPTPARLPQLLQGLGSGGPALRLRARCARVLRSCLPSSNQTSASARSPKRGRSSRCAVSRSHGQARAPRLPGARDVSRQRCASASST